MPEIVTLADGTEREVLTQADLDAAAAAVAAPLQTEIEKLNRVNAEKSENILKLRDMTEEQKAKFSATELESRRVAEAAEERAAKLEESIQNDANARAQKAKDAAIAKYSGGNAELKQKLTDSWGLVNLEGTDPDTIDQRASLVFNMVTGGTPAPNPLTQGIDGQPPQQRTQEQQEAFLNSERGQAALAAMGMEPVKAPEAK